MAIIQQLFILFSLIVIGFIARKRGVVTHAVNAELSKLILKICMPAFILSSMNIKFSAETFNEANALIVISFIVYFFSILLSKVYTRVINHSNKSWTVIEYVIVFSNSGFMGYPVIKMVLGDTGVFYAAMYNLSFNVLIWTYGVGLFSGGKLNKKTLKNLIQPATFSILLGYMMFIFNVSMPPAVMTLLKMVGSITTPLSMMFIGFVLTEISFKSSLANVHIYLTSLVRLLIIPLLTFLVLSFFGASGYMLAVPVIITGMPAAVNGAIFASEYGADYKLASVLVFVSTLLSVVTIPLLLKLVI